MFPHLLSKRGPGRYVAPGGGAGDSDGGLDEQPIVTVAASGDVTINGKVKTGSFGKFVYPLATVAAGRQYTFRAVANFAQLARQGNLAMVGVGFKASNDFHITGLRGDGSGGTKEYIVHGTSPNGWNKQTGHTEVDGGTAGAGTQHSAYYRLTTSSDGTTYALETSANGSAWTSVYTVQSLTPFTNVSSVTTFGIALWFNNADAGQFSIVIDQFADASAALTDILLVMVAGQSNARSYDTTGSDVPVGLQTPDANVRIWNTQTNALETYVPGTNSDAWNSGASTPQKWGPEAAFAHDFRAANPMIGVCIVKVAVDSTTLAVDAASDWSPSHAGELFDDMTAEITAALSALGVSPIATALLWMQGEWDALDVTKGGNYGVNLTDFVTNIRTDWGDGSTKVILGRITPSVEWATAGTSVRAFQARVARDMSDVQAIDTDSYTLAVDNKHYVAASVQTMGEDMFDAYAGTYTLLPVRFGTMSADKSASVTLSNGNLTAAGTGVSSSALQPVRCDQVPGFGKSYWEVLVDAQTASLNVGIGKAVSMSGFWGQASDSVGYNAAGAVFKNNASIATYATYTTGDRIQVAYDSATGKVWFGKNGTFNGSPSAGTGQATTLTSNTTTSYHRIGATLRRSGDQVTLKMRAADFAHTPPTGFSAI